MGAGNGTEGTGVDGNNTRGATFSINVSSVNEAPVVTAPATLTINEDSTNNLVAGISIADTDDFGSPEKVMLDRQHICRRCRCRQYFDRGAGQVAI